MKPSIHTHLLFESGAEEAMRAYVALFPDSEVKSCQRYEEPHVQGKLKVGTFTLFGSLFSCADSPVKHAFGFTPAISLFIDFAKESELEEAFAALAKGGEVMMPLDNYGFSRRFAWVGDRFGVSWQLNLP